MTNGFICGAFDLLHPGHAVLLSDCRKRCDQLFVGLHTNPFVERDYKNKPVQTTYERYLQLAYHKSVYHVIPYDTEKDLENILATLDLQVRFLGADYERCPELVTGMDICERRGIKIIYLNRMHNWSSSHLRTRILENAECQDGKKTKSR